MTIFYHSGLIQKAIDGYNVLILERGNCELYSENRHRWVNRRQELDTKCKKFYGVLVGRMSDKQLVRHAIKSDMQGTAYHANKTVYMLARKVVSTKLPELTKAAIGTDEYYIDDYDERSELRAALRY